jgi:hypothetical protein
VSLPFFFRTFHPPTCAYLSPSIFCRGSSPSAKPISSHSLCHSHVYIPFLPHVSRHHQISGELSIRQFSFSFHSDSTPPTSSPTSLATKNKRIYFSDMLFFYLTFLIGTYLVTVLHPLRVRHLCLLVRLIFPFYRFLSEVDTFDICVAITIYFSFSSYLPYVSTVVLQKPP